MAEQFLTVAEAAQRLRLSEVTVRRYLKWGWIRGTKPLSDRAGWRIPESEIERLLSTATKKEPAEPEGPTG